MRAALLALALPTAGAGVEQRIEGSVLETRVTYCELTRRAGCAGTLLLKRMSEGEAEALRFRVAPGTPISCDGEPVHLGALKGETVVITEAQAGVALAVQVVARTCLPAPRR